MRLPKMVPFDYGQTLVAEEKFDGVKGTRAVLQYATKNKYNMSAEEVQEHANRINTELGRLEPIKRHTMEIEIPNSTFAPYLYESVGIELSIGPSEVDRLFWDAASPGRPTDGIEMFLEYLKEKGIRTGVISNITYDSDVVKERINRLIPSNEFEFIIATSSYLFRKPNKHIFELALEKANLRAGDVWYIGAIDLPYTEDKDVCTISAWKELIELVDCFCLKEQGKM